MSLSITTRALLPLLVCAFLSSGLLSCQPRGNVRAIHKTQRPRVAGRAEDMEGFRFDHEPSVGVATIQGKDWQSTADRVYKALGKSHVPAIIVGSSISGWGVWVRKGDREKALRILEEDSRKHGYSNSIELWR